MASPDHSTLARLGARWWYLWGLSVCYSANVLANKRLYRAGVWSFQRAVKLWPTFVQAYVHLGTIRGRELGEYSAAIVDLERATALRPELPEPYLQRGLLHRFNGDPAAAARDLRRYLERAPEGFWRAEAERQLLALQRDPGGESAPML